VSSVAAAADLHTTPQHRLGLVYRRITVVAISVLWLTGTDWHVLSIAAEQ